MNQSIPKSPKNGAQHQNGHANGVNGHHATPKTTKYAGRTIDSPEGQYDALRHLFKFERDKIEDAKGTTDKNGKRGREITPEHFQDPAAGELYDQLLAFYSGPTTNPYNAEMFDVWLLSHEVSDASYALFHHLMAPPEKPLARWEDCAHTVLNGKKADANTSGIPAPQLVDKDGVREYAPRQIVTLLYPDWEVENITSHAAHALRIRDALGDDLRNCPQLGWLGYDGARWVTDDKHATTIAKRAASLSAQVSQESGRLFDLAAQLSHEDRVMDASAMGRAAVALLKHSKQCETRNFVEGALHFAAGDDTKIRVTHETFDQKPWVIGFQNLTWAHGKKREHQRNDYLMHLSLVLLNGEIDQSEWLQVLARITGNDAAFAQTLQDIAGYILSGASHLRFLPWAYGPKGTGKSTFTELLQTVLGPMAAMIDPKMLGKDASRERLGASLWNKRMAVCAEAGNQRIDADLLKTLSGADTLSVRFLFREPFDAPPRHVLVMVANDPPRMDAYDEALKDRVVALPFVHPLAGNESLRLTGGARIEAVRQDPNSPLVRGFAAWAMEGLERVHKTQCIYRAPAIAEATAKFWADTDPITPFWATLTEADWGKGIAKSSLRELYEKWCQEEGIRPVAARQWTKACVGYGLQDSKNDSVRVWKNGTKGTKQEQNSKSPCKKEEVSCKVSENGVGFVPFVPFSGEIEESEVLS